MANGAKTSSSGLKASKSAVKSEPTIKSTPARNTTVPPKAKAVNKAVPSAVSVTREMIAERAYHLWLSGAPGSEFDHWCAAERELNGRK